MEVGDVADLWNVSSETPIAIEIPIPQYQLANSLPPPRLIPFDMLVWIDRVAVDAQELLGIGQQKRDARANRNDQEAQAIRKQERSRELNSAHRD